MFDAGDLAGTGRNEEVGIGAKLRFRVPVRCALGSAAGTIAKDTRGTLATTRFLKKGDTSSTGSVPDLGTLPTTQKMIERAILNRFLIA